MTVVVVDTSVYVSALVFGGVPQAAVSRALASPFRLAVSRQIKAELLETLEGRFRWEPSRAVTACDHLWQSALWCEPVSVQAARDPNDDHVLGCALAGGALMLVTGDNDLLALNPFKGIAILAPAAFLASVATLPGSSYE